ncbi:MAG: XRE family transcriptional regulator [Sphingobacteriales bacterium]|nr:MAG: XRE family transcriptional regulator [Sphingobacteriales bacterium]
MMDKSDINIYSKSDKFYIEQIGNYIRNHRLDQNRTQSELAESAGLSRSTLVQLESGKRVNLISMVQALRALKKLHVLNEMEYIPQVSPLKLAALEQQQRQRARGKKTETPDKPKSDW